MRDRTIRVKTLCAVKQVDDGYSWLNLPEKLRGYIDDGEVEGGVGL